MLIRFKSYLRKCTAFLRAFRAGVFRFTVVEWRVTHEVVSKLFVTHYFYFRRDHVLDRNRITVALRRLSRKHVTFKKRSGFEPKSDHCSPETSVKKTCYFHIWRDQILPNWDPLILTGFWRQKVSKSVSREANFRHWYLWHGAELKNLFVGTLIG